MRLRKVLKLGPHLFEAFENMVSDLWSERKQRHIDMLTTCMKGCQYTVKYNHRLKSRRRAASHK